MSNIVLVFLFILLSFFLVKSRWVRRSGIKPRVIVVLFAIKSLLGFALVVLYATFYNKANADIYLYFNDAIYLKHLFLNDANVFWNIVLDYNVNAPQVYEKYTQLMFWASSSVDFIVHEKKTVILLNFIFSFISFNNIYIHSMLMAFIGFLGQVALFRFVKRQTNIQPIFILLVTFLLPTFVLWSSTILKEPLIIFVMGMSLFYAGKWTKKWKTKYLLALLIFLFLGLFVKAYAILALFFPLFIFILFKYKPDISRKKQSVIVFSSLVLMLVFAYTLSFSSFNIFEKLSNKQNQFIEMVQKVEQEKEVGSQITVEKLNPSLISFIYNLPSAFSNVMFKPGFYDFRNLLYLPDIFQNILILVLSLFITFRNRNPSKSEFPFLWFSILFIVILFSLIGLVTPVLGAIVRYKIPALIFVFYFVFVFLKIDKKYQKFDKYIFY